MCFVVSMFVIFSFPWTSVVKFFVVDVSLIDCSWKSQVEAQAEAMICKDM
jgi:hypothetical protein